jgi:3-deoxy-D-manno-octulosonate cytidylyltransferase
MRTAVIIPSRLASQRLPRKALYLIKGKTLVERVWERAKQAEGIDEVFVATDHEDIASVVRAFGGKVLMTSVACPSGTDRVAEAAKQLASDYDVVINVQGDEPLIDPSIISSLAKVLQQNESVVAATPVALIANNAELTNPNIVKTVIDAQGNALYFSRLPIPYIRDLGEAHIGEWPDKHRYYKHIGIYAYRQSVLAKFTSMPESSLEIAERLEQLRLLEAGIPIRTITVTFDSIAVDTIEDVGKVEEYLETNQLA